MPFKHGITVTEIESGARTMPLSSRSTVPYS